jgi:hypothetical protein
MKRWLPIVSLLVACAAEEAPPNDLLPRDQFKRLLMNAQLIEARTSRELVNPEGGPKVALEQYAALFASEKVTVEEYRQTFNWYAAHPKHLKPIYEEILTELQKASDSSAHQPARPPEGSDR